MDSLKEIGLTRNDIDYVVLTHLHFDHVGGVTSLINGITELTFPNAIHIFQKKEWEIAKDSDDLNKASYNFERDLKLLEESGKYRLINGDYQLTEEVTLEFTSGHSEGTQVVRIESESELAYYPGDIMPMEVNRHLAVTTSFDLNRKKTFHAKKKILSEIKERNGVIFLEHDPKKQFLKFGE